MRQSRAQALIAGAAIVSAAALAAAVLHFGQTRRRPRRTYDYSDRSGFPRSPEEMRGVARAKKRAGLWPALFRRDD